MDETLTSSSRDDKCRYRPTPNDKNSQMLTRKEFLIKYKVRNTDRQITPCFLSR